MAESFVIFFVIVAVLIVIGFFLLSNVGDLIFSILLLLVGIGFIIGGIALLVKVGGGVGALGIFLALIGIPIISVGVEGFRDFKFFDG